MAVARFLSGHPKVGAVHYPGLATHPGHDLAARQQFGFGAMLSFELEGELKRFAISFPACGYSPWRNRWAVSKASSLIQQP